MPVTLARGDAAWVEDVHGRRYLDLLAAYSALNFGHAHPHLVRAAHAQLERLTLTSRAFGNDQLAPFCRELATLCGKDLVLPMNTGAESVETAIKAARRWGYTREGCPGRTAATIIVFDGNFHGRTTTIVGFSSDPAARDGFGPFAPGFRTVPYGDLDAAAGRVRRNTVAVLVEPVQGEAGVVVPPDGYLAAVRVTLHRPQRFVDRRRDPVRARAHRAGRSRATTRTSAPISTSSARRSAAGSCRSPRSTATGTCSASWARIARKHVRRQPARVRDRP